MNDKDLPKEPYSDLQMTIALIKINDKLDTIETKISENAQSDITWRVAHEVSDGETHSHLHERISNMKKYLVSVMLVSLGSGSVLGVVGSYLLKFFKGHS